MRLPGERQSNTANHGTCPYKSDGFFLSTIVIMKMEGILRLDGSTIAIPVSESVITFAYYWFQYLDLPLLKI